MNQGRDGDLQCICWLRCVWESRSLVNKGPHSGLKHLYPILYEMDRDGLRQFTEMLKVGSKEGGTRSSIDQNENLTHLHPCRTFYISPQLMSNILHLTSTHVEHFTSPQPMSNILDLTSTHVEHSTSPRPMLNILHHLDPCGTFYITSTHVEHSTSPRPMSNILHHLDPCWTFYISPQPMSTIPHLISSLSS